MSVCVWGVTSVSKQPGAYMPVCLTLRQQSWSGFSSMDNTSPVA